MSFCFDCSQTVEKQVLNRDLMYLCVSLVKLFKIRLRLHYIIVQRSPVAIAKAEDEVLSQKKKKLLVLLVSFQKDRKKLKCILK